MADEAEVSPSEEEEIAALMATEMLRVAIPWLSRVPAARLPHVLADSIVGLLVLGEQASFMSRVAAPGLISTLKAALDKPGESFARWHKGAGKC